MFKRTTAINKLGKLTKRKKIIQGGTSAGKTYGILPLLINKATKNKRLEISVVSESIPHLKRGAMKDFLKILYDTNRFVRSHWNASNFKYTFSNGSYIEFFSVDQEDRVRGARRNILYVNEANNINFDTYYQLAIRTDQDIWLDFNPTAEFWAHTEVLPDDDSELIILTYEDNEALQQTIIDEIKKAKEKAKTSKYWENWWNVYGLGQIGSLQGVIISDWETIDKIPKDARYVGSGLDFGYTNDPTTLIDVYYYNQEYIFDEVLYQSGLMNNQIAKNIKGELRRFVYADSAEPKSIAEIAMQGVSIRGADKGQDSIRFGLNLLQSRHIHITSNSTNLIKELRSYVWDTDRQGNTLNKPIDDFNHCIDAMRYWAMMAIGRSQKVDLR